MCVQLNLTRAVKDGEGFFVPIAQRFVKPVEVLEKKTVRYEIYEIRIRGFQESQNWW